MGILPNELSAALDAYGADCPATLASLFAQDGEVAELAWLEWHLQQAFATPDRTELSGAKLAEAGLGDGDWERLRLRMAAGFAARPVTHNCEELWQALRSGDPAGIASKLADPGTLIVWRQAQTPRFRVLAMDEFAGLDCLARGEPFGAVAELDGESGAPVLGDWFAQWLGDGLFAGCYEPARASRSTTRRRVLT